MSFGHPIDRQHGTMASSPLMFLQPQSQPTPIPITLEWIRSMATVAAVLTALAIALWGDWMKRFFFKPNLELKAFVRRPEAEKVGRQVSVRHPLDAGAIMFKQIGEAWFFRLAISNLSRTPARDVQVYLKQVQKLDGTNVTRFTPMNLKWSYTGETTRKVLLEDIPVLCDFIHISDPAHKAETGEDLDDVAPDKGVISLDVEATTSAKSHLLAPGAYLFFLYVAAENCRARLFVVEVRYDGNWTVVEDQMLDHEVGFRMKKADWPTWRS